VSLVDGPDELDVYPEILGTDSDGNRVRKPGATPVTVRGRMSPLSAAEAQAEGQGVTTTYKFLCREFPAGAWARVAWGGRDWDVQGEPQWVALSRATAHWRVVLRARAPKAL
jgi:hypothetical protein